jgi:two-component system cell cycle response regulator
MTNFFDSDDDEATMVGSRSRIRAALAQSGKTQRPWLVVVSGGGNIGKMYRLEHRIVLGRSPQCDVVIDEDGVSRRHAMLERTVEGNVQLVDLESRNGTFVNGDAISRVTLRDGDKLQIGSTTILKLSYQDELEEAMQRNLYESATRDPLTHAVNRRGFEEALDKELAFARRHGTDVSLLAFDVDHFKRVNDTHGHAAGDAVLKRLAEIVSGSIRAEDVFARIGGEEFVVLLRGIARHEALAWAERMRGSVERAAFMAGDVRIPVTISVGVATSRAVANGSPTTILEAADASLYEAKRAGRNRVVGSERSAPPAGATAEVAGAADATS